ncbi:Avirulence (Avh) protein [Phytophthora megakarya]|uniref:Avirulence (Avh) protein n=1 Tax=Phytophthora megakarya TaxID=4795 RepID=A0A225US30_9STRA|nr:Avirulence (Avh) protein [Phytophthora megakarya]
MRLQLNVLLTLATILLCATKTTKARSVLINEDINEDDPTKRLLRSDVPGDDDGEERAMIEGLTKLVNPSRLTAVQRLEAALAKLANKHPYSITEAFKSLKLDKFKNVKAENLKVNDVDKLFTGKKYDLWYTSLGRWNNRQQRKYRTNVAQMFNQELGSKKAFEVFSVAATSKNRKVQDFGNNFQTQLLKQLYDGKGDYQKISSILGSDEAAAKMFGSAQLSSNEYDQRLGEWFAKPLLRKWIDQGKSGDEVVKISPALRNQYSDMLVSRAAEANGRANDLARAAAARARPSAPGTLRA